MSNINLKQNQDDNLKLFQRYKEQTLNKDDLSRKGSIDEPIRNLVEIINNNPYYYTTSTCSGRITLIEKPLGRSGLKKGSTFHLNSHEKVDYDNVNSLIESRLKSIDNEESLEKCLWFKFEPFIMHVQCFNLEKAGLILNLALAAGCRNSGITLGKPEKFMVAFRSTSSMEVPVLSRSKFQVQENYIRFLCDEANQRLSDSMDRLSKLENSISSFLESDNK